MFMALNAPAIGIKNMPLPQQLALAEATGFAGLDFDIREAHGLANAHSPAALKDLFAKHNQRPATWNLPVRGPQTEWDVDADELAALAKTAAAMGATRCITWVPSWHESRPLLENRAYHVKRFRAIAAILDSEGCSLGLEFLGPKELLGRGAHPFIRRMEDMLALTQDIAPNVGLLVDAYHLYTSGGAVADLARIAPDNIVLVHINDALKGVAMDDLPDTSRALPLETGVLDLDGFMRALARLGYAGPVVTEPFSERLNGIAATNPQTAAQEVADRMKRLWVMSGLG